MKKTIYVILALLMGYIVYQKFLKDLLKKSSESTPAPAPIKVAENVTTGKTVPKIYRKI